jgi:hypothetical protein
VRRAGDAQAAAAFKNGNRLWSLCSQPPNSVAKAECAGYVLGVVDAIKEDDAVNGFTACLPTEVTTVQVVDVVTDYLRQNPAERHYLAAGLVARALARAFPCR